MPPPAITEQATPPEATGAHARTLLATVFLFGTLLTLIGSVLPVWGYHRLDAFIDLGNHFLAIAAGFTIASFVASASLRRYPQWVLGPAPGCAFAALGVILFAVTPPPFPIWWQLAGALCVGTALGALTVSLFHQFGALARLQTSSTFHLANFFGLFGAFATPVGVAITVTATSSLALLPLAVVPLAIGASAVMRPARFVPDETERSFREALEDFRNPPAILLALLLFFQLGNEMALLGWIPVFLIQRLGVSPASGLYALAAFAFALLIGRTFVQSLRGRARRNRYLLAGLLLGILGCSMLTATNNLFGAILGVMLVGLGFSPIYPVTLERIGGRFPYFHPGIFNSIFSLGLIGGMLAPWSLGLFAHYFGIQVVMTLPIAGALLVSLLLALIWLESRLAGLPDSRKRNVE